MATSPKSSSSQYAGATGNENGRLAGSLHGTTAQPSALALSLARPRPHAGVAPLVPRPSRSRLMTETGSTAGAGPAHSANTSARRNIAGPARQRGLIAGSTQMVTRGRE